MEVPLDVLKLIPSYITKHRMKLLDWIDLDKLNWYGLSNNFNAIDLLEANQDKISWTNLSINPNAIHLLEANLEKINWNQLSKNKNAIHLLKLKNIKVSLFIEPDLKTVHLAKN